MKLMKHVHHLGNVGTLTSEFLGDLGNITGFQLHQANASIFKESSLDMIPLCSEYGSEKLQTRCWELFQPVNTDHGICHSFNALSPRSIFSNDVYPNEFEKAFGNCSNDVYTLLKGLKSNAGLTFYLDKQSFMRGDNLYSK